MLEDALQTAGQGILLPPPPRGRQRTLMEMQPSSREQLQQQQQQQQLRRLHTELEGSRPLHSGAQHGLRKGMPPQGVVEGDDAEDRIAGLDSLLAVDDADNGGEDDNEGMDGCPAQRWRPLSQGLGSSLGGGAEGLGSRGAGDVCTQGEGAICEDGSGGRSTQGECTSSRSEGRAGSLASPPAAAAAGSLASPPAAAAAGSGQGQGLEVEVEVLGCFDDDGGVFAVPEVPGRLRPGAARLGSAQRTQRPRSAGAPAAGGSPEQGCLQVSIRCIVHRERERGARLGSSAVSIASGEG